jgi:hypothetical protein
VTASALDGINNDLVDIIFLENCVWTDFFLATGSLADLKVWFLIS